MNLRKSVGRLFGLATMAAIWTTLVTVGGPDAAAADQKDKIDTLKAKPLSDNLKSFDAKPVKGTKLRVPTITWPGDVSTVFADQDGIFKGEGLDVELFNENDFAKQVQGVINGETPILRGTLGQQISALEAFQKSGLEMVYAYQLTWSNGGDCLVVRPGIKNLADLKGKKIALQLYGPHMDFLTTVLARAGLKVSDVNLVWLKELQVPAYDTKGRINDPRSAFVADPSIDACLVISPDAAALTSNGTGTGAEGSVKGAKVLFSSKAANRIIADVYAIRKDWFDANKATAEKFVHALMTGQEKFEGVLADKTGNAAKYKELLKRSTKLLYGSDDASAIKDNEGSLGDCEWVGFQGNVGFFTGAGTTRNLAILTNEIQSAFLDLGLMTKRVDVNKASWDYTTLAKGLKNVDLAAVPKAAFDTAKAQKRIEGQIKTELDAYMEDSLFSFEIYFDPNAVDFSKAEYQESFKKLLEISQTFAGAQLIVEGHNSPDLINKYKELGKSPTEISQVEQVAKTVSYRRSEAVRAAYIEFVKKQPGNLRVDESQFLIVGLGVAAPKHKTPTTAQEKRECRRVVFRVKAIQTESDN